MAFPTILIHSGSGSDVAASGAGPTTALTGSAATTDGTGTVVTLDGSPDLSGVATDGSAVIKLFDTTASARNFGKITAVNNTLKTVTVANAFRTNILAGESIDWAIGGKLASINNTNNRKLFDNASGDGDLKPGWIVEFQSGHTETLTTTLNLRGDGNTTDGYIQMRGAALGTRPVLTFSNDGNGFIPRGRGWRFNFFEVRNSAATKTASVAFLPVTTDLIWEDIKIAHSTDKFWRAFDSLGGSQRLLYCEVGHCANIGINVVLARQAEYRACWVHDCTSHGISFDANAHYGLTIGDCLITDNGSRGIHWDNSGPDDFRGTTIRNNTIDGNTSDGIRVANNDASLIGLVIENNILSNNGGYGLNFSAVSITATLLNFYGTQVRNNNTFGNTSGAYFPTGFGSDDPGLDPQFTSAGSNDYSIGSNLANKGYPLTELGTASTTLSFVDIGAAQRAATGGSRIIASPRDYAIGRTIVT